MQASLKDGELASFHIVVTEAQAPLSHDSAIVLIPLAPQPPSTSWGKETQALESSPESGESYFNQTVSC